MSAIISPCGNYRYRLERTISLFGPTAAIIMVNPSTADAEIDDATIRRVIDFAKRFGWSKIVIGNVFAYRATDIRDLAIVEDPSGPENVEHLSSIINGADNLVFAWGTLGKLPRNLKHNWGLVHEIAVAGGRQALCFGVAKDGHPRHPLMLSKETQLVDWSPPGA